ncbi:MAG: hypothetical protein ACLQPD_18960 [Desulfomonilaceae bacterium]
MRGTMKRSTNQKWTGIRVPDDAYMKYGCIVREIADYTGIHCNTIPTTQLV